MWWIRSLRFSPYSGANPATNECHVAYADAGATASDDCTGGVGVSTNSPVDVNAPGVYVVTYTSDDGNGNTNTATRTVYVVDTAAPVITLLGPNPVTNECHVAYVDAGATASDACAGDVSVSTNGSVDVNLPGVYSVTYTTDDGAGHTNSATRTVYVEDTTAPLITYYFTNQTLSANGSCQALMPDVTGTDYILAEDVCGAITIAQTPTNNALLNLGPNEVVLAVADAAGNTAYATNTIVVVDATGPVVTLIGENPLTVECQATFSDPGASAIDNCSGVVAVTTNILVNANVPGVHAVTYTSDDGNGNTNTVTRMVQVVDSVAPTLTILGADPATNECHVPYVDAGATALDACAGSVGVSTNSAVDADTPGIYVVTYTTDDRNGNTNRVTRTVHIVDSVAPVIAILGANPATNECHVPYADAGATASDACAGAAGVATNNPVDANVPGVYLVVYTSDDGNGNTNTATRTVYVTDTVGPVIGVAGPNPATNECHAAYTDAGATASDACAGDVSISTNSTVDANLPGLYTVTYTSDDGNGNTNSATRTVYVEDTTAPLITYYFTNLTLSANSSCQVLMPDVTGTDYILAEDVCGAITITQTPTNNALLNLGPNEVVLAVADSAGNIVYATNTIVVEDTTPPAITLNGANPLTVECHDSFGDPGASASDNCSGIVTVTTNGVVNVDVPGSYTIEYRAADAAGNSVTNTRIVSVVDTVGPMIVVLGADPVTNECHVAYTDAGATANDTCAGDVGVVVTSTVDTNVPGVYTITYVSDDGNGNTNTATRTVHVLDRVVPALTVLGANPTTNECHVPYADAGATASDACAGLIAVSTNDLVNADVPGVYTVTYLAHDGNGNTNTATRVVYVLDTAAPVIALLGANPVTNECHTPYVDVGATADDACAGSVGVLTNNPVDANVPGVYTVVYTSDDGNGNTNTATRTVYVADTVGPMIVILGANPATNECHVAYADSGATASDACAGSVVLATNGTVDANVPGVYVATYTADDGNGNTNVATRTVYVVDSVGPVLVCGTNKTVECGSLWSFDEPAAEDGCAGPNVTLVVLATVTNANVLTRTWAVSDPAGNTNTCSQSVTVSGTAPPVITLLGANPATNECHATYTDAGATASDACAGAVSISTNSTVDANVPGVYSVIYVADDGDGHTNTATRTVYVVDTTAPLIVCGTNKVVQCGNLWSFDEPVTEDACAGTNVTLVVLETVTNGNVLTRTWAVSDPVGNTNTCSQSVTVVDTAAPVLTLLGANPATNECHATYTDAGATASDACAGTVSVSTNSIVAANVPGVYSVTYTADDGVGNTNTATRTVYVADTTAPLITYYFTNLTLSANGSCQALMPDVTGTDYILAEDVCGTILITQTPTNQALLNLGTNEVVLTVADSVGNTTSSTNTIVVGDTAPPAITLNGANPVIVECHGSFGDPGASANDNCSGIVAVTTNGIVNADVPGSYTLEYSATDAAGNSVTNARIVNVVDTTPPVIVCSPDKNAECGSPWSFNEPTASDSCSGTNVSVVISGTVTNGLTFTRTWLASDEAGNTNSCSQSVTLMDTMPPAITYCPTNRSLTVSDNCIVVMPDFTGELTAIDSCSAVSVSQNPPAGSEIGVGQYDVTFTASDAASNSSSCTLFLIVNPPAGANTNISISEFAAKNTTGNTDNYGVYSDWIEVHNAGTCPVNLDGWGLTDDVTLPGKWLFPATNIAPGQFLVVWASDRNQRVPGSPLHANFKLSDEGEYLALFQADGVTIATQFSPAFPPQLPDVSYGLPADRSTNDFLAWPTPGLANSPATNFMVGVTNISISEFMAKNTFTLVDEDGVYSDWIEIHNAGSFAVNLNGWALTDNPAQLTKWRFPATNIAAGQFLVVWASDKNRRTPGRRSIRTSRCPTKENIWRWFTRMVSRSRRSSAPPFHRSFPMCPTACHQTVGAILS